MEREISSGAMLGIVLLALAAVIALGFGVFAITKGVANEGTVGVQDSLGSVSSQVFLDYDQKVVSGTQAISGLKTFEGKPYAVLFGTKALQGGGKTNVGHTSYPVLVGTKKFLNYNAILALSSGGGDWTAGDKLPANTAMTTGRGVLTFANGAYEATNGFASASGNIVFDKDTGGIFKQGNAEYVATSAKYQANLIKDPSDNILGIVLEQQ